MSSLTRSRIVVFVGVLAALVLAISWWRIDHPTTDAATTVSATPTPTPTESPAVSLLVQLRDDQQLAVGNEQLIVGRTGTAQGIVAPSLLLVHVAGAGPMTLAETGKLPSPNNAGGAVSDLLGIRVDATLILDRLAYEALVDSVGGVLVAVDTAVTKKQPDGTTVVVVPPGTRVLDGPAATAYAMFSAPGENPSAQEKRFATVNRGVFAKLPKDAQKIKGILGSLGASSRSSVPPDEVAMMLLRLRDASLSGRLAEQNLPVTTVDSTYPTQYRLDFLPMDNMIDTTLSDVKLPVPPPSNVRVLVFDGIAQRALVSAAAAQLDDAKLRYVDGGPALGVPVAKTQVFVSSADPEAIAFGRDVIRALNLPATTNVIATASGSNPADGAALANGLLGGLPDPRLVRVADVTVVLGADYLGPGATPSPSTSG